MTNKVNIINTLYKSWYVRADCKPWSHRTFILRTWLKIAKILITEQYIQTPKEYDEFINKFTIRFALPHWKTRRWLWKWTKKRIDKEMKTISTIISKKSYLPI